MFDNRRKILNFAKEFIEICEKEDIWYSLDAFSLKGSIKHGGFIPWHQKFDVMITLKGYQKLKRLYNKNIIDSSMDKSYNKLNPSFVANNEEWKKRQIFIDIRLLIPTTIKKANKFCSLPKKIKNIFTLIPNNNIKIAINELLEETYFEGYYVLDKRRTFNRNNWIQAITYKTTPVRFSGIIVDILEEYKEILNYWYGKNYLDKNDVPLYWYNYVSPHEIQKERIK